MRKRHVACGALALVLAVVGMEPQEASARRGPALLRLPAPASPKANLELIGEFGFVDRSTTGIGGSLLGRGYDASAGSIAGAQLRVFFPIMGRTFGHGFDMRYSRSAGPTLGADGYALGLHMLDLGYTMRFEGRCMRSDTARWFFSGTLGLSGYDAQTGPGDGADQWPAQFKGQTGAFDHQALGWLLSVNMDAHLEEFIVGVGLNLRQHFGISDSPVQRNFMLSLVLRLGFDIDL